MTLSKQTTYFQIIKNLNQTTWLDLDWTGQAVGRSLRLIANIKLNDDNGCASNWTELVSNCSLARSLSEGSGLVWSLLLLLCSFVKKEKKKIKYQAKPLNSEQIFTFNSFLC